MSVVPIQVQIALINALSLRNCHPPQVLLSLSRKAKHFETIFWIFRFAADYLSRHQKHAAHFRISIELLKRTWT
jgi:hypothetical protein